MDKLIYTFLFFSLVLSSCTQEEKKEKPIDYKQVNEGMILRNKIWHEQEMMDIDAFVKRHKWNVITTGTGLKYVIYESKDTTAPKAKEGMLVKVNYSISLLNDSICYTSEGEPQEFLVGMDNVESGLHEGVTYLHIGDKAKIILSSNLAFGLIGDMDQIPPQSPLVYDIELVDVLDANTHKSIRNEK